MRTLYVHIGTPKTGTSTLQHFLINNKEKLEEKGVFYPIWDGPKTADGGKDAIDGNFGWILRNNIEYEEKDKRMLSLFEKHDIVLLSTENIWMEAPDKCQFFHDLIKYWEDVEIKVIVYLRKQVDYLESQYRECIRVGDYAIPVRECLTSDDNTIKSIREKGCNYYSELESIASIIGRENILVRPYEKMQFKNGNIIDDFLGVLEISRDKDFTSATNYNFSMSNKTLELKRHMNAADACESKKMNELFYDILMKNDRNIIDNKYVVHFKSQLEDIHRKEFMKRFEEGNRKIAIEYLHKENGCLFEEEDLAEYEEISTDELLEQAIKMFTAMNVQLHEQFECEYLKLSKNLVKLKEEIFSENLEIREEISNLSSMYQHEVEILEQQLSNKQQELFAIKNGYSWKITAPLRKIRRLIFRNK